MIAVAIIPARGGSIRIPGKNIRRFHGKEIIAYSIETAIESKLFDVVMVSTEDPKIAAIAATHGAEILIRPPEFARDWVGTQDVMAQALQDMDHAGRSFEYACCIYATAPMIRIEDLMTGRTMISDPWINYVFSVGTQPVLHDAGQWYWGKSAAFMERLPLIETRTMMVPVQPERDCDINTQADWDRAECMFANLNKEIA